MRSFTRTTPVLWVSAAILWSLLLTFVGLQLATPSDGARLPPGAIQPGANGLLVAPLASSGLRSDDIVITVEGQSIETLARGLTDFNQPSQWACGQTITYTVMRDGARRDIPITLGLYPFSAIFASDWGAIVMAVVFQLVTGFVFFKRPQEAVARVMFMASAGMVAATTWSIGLTITDVAGKAGFWLYALSTLGAYMLVSVGALHTTLLFPTPWPLLARHRWIEPTLYAAPYVVFATVTLIIPTPNALAWLQHMGNTTGFLQGGYVLLALAAAVRSYRAARDPVSRAQVRWVITAFVFVFFCDLAFGIIPELMLGYPFLSWNVLALIGLLVPLAFAVAILRYHLFDIDVILNRTLVYGTLTTIVVSLYVAIVGSLTALLQLQNNLLVSLTVTALVAIIFQPLRHRLQRAVNRFMYGERDDPYAVLSRLGRQLESTLAPDSVLPTIVETVAQTLKLPYAAITLREADTDKVTASFGLPPSPPTPLPMGEGRRGEGLTLPLHFQHELIGHLLVAQRSPDEPFTPAERRLLEDIARQIEVAVHNVRLTADLQRSRERLVTTREEERRRIRRDLHDGLGPTLASHSYRLDAVLDLIDQNPDAAKTLIADLKTQTQTTLADIRRLVYELRPPALDELGLVGALQAQWVAQNGLHVSIESPPEGLPPLTAAVEVAAYRIAMEAVTNAARHASACNCLVRFTAKETQLALEITDDGCGISPDARAGVGLASMKERAAELGGVCVIEPPPTGGTKVIARLPITMQAPRA